MSQVRRRKRRNNRNLGWARRIIAVVLIAVSVYFLYFAAREVLTTIRLQRELTEVQTKLQDAQDENKYLNEEKEKLQDPDYIENYARGSYMLTKEGEQIFYLPENTNK